MQEPTAPHNPLFNGHDATERPGKISRVSDMSIGSNDTSHAPSTASASQQTSEDAANKSEELQDEPAIESRTTSPVECLPYRSTIIELVSISASSSAFPESFGLSVSSKGRWIVAYSSGALYLIPAQQLPTIQNCCRAFRLRRKPLAVVINDVGNYAILNNTYKVDVYKCGDGSLDSLSGPNQKVQTIQLNTEARAIALSANGELVAAGSDVGVEIVGLGLPEGSDRRQIQSGPVESITFSDDQKSLLITGPSKRTRTTTLLSISISFEQAMMMDDAEEDQQIPVGKLWISQLIFPEQLQARQSVFLPDPSNGQACELLAYDKQMDRFGIFDTVLKTFTGKALSVPEEVIWAGNGRYEDTLLGVSTTGTHVAVAVRLDHISEIWAYETPSDWREEDGPITNNSPIQRLIMAGQANTPAESVNCLRWIEEHDEPPSKLLALISTTARSMPEDMEATAATAASGKIVLFDLDARTGLERLGQDQITVDLDEYPLTEELAEEQVEMEHEIDLVRRRTQVQRTRQSQRNREPQRTQDIPAIPQQRLRRSNSTSSRNSHTGPLQEVDLHSSRLPRRRSFSSISDVGDDNDFGPGVAVDEPYSQSAPRPQFMLNRAATVAQHAPAIHLRGVPSRPLEYRRADGLREIPHESDADNWVPPPPPYTERPDAPGPNAVSLPIHTIPGLAERVLQGSHVQPNQNPSPHGMRSRVSQVVSGFQVPAMIPQPRPQAQLRYADPARPPGLPTNVSIGSGSVRRVPASAFPVSSQVSRHLPSPTAHVTRRPTTSHPRPPSSRLSINPAAPSSAPLEMAASPVPTHPTPGVLNSPLTFPSAQRNRGRNRASLVIPRSSSQRSFSAPVTPINQTRPNFQPNRNSQQVYSPQTPVSASSGATSHQYSHNPRVSPEETFVPPSAPFTNSPSRRVASAERMRPLPPLPGRHSQLFRHSSDLPTESPTHFVQPPLLGQLSMSHLDHYKPQDSPETPSRRHWWKGGNTPTRPMTSAAHTPVVARQGTSISERQEKKEKCVIM
jgi:hypothetical protein